MYSNKSTSPIKVTKIYQDSQSTADKLERWMESYMVLKRKTEHTSEIYQRELSKSWESEKEYALQIKQLCDTINDMSEELFEGKTTLATYTTHLRKVTGHLQHMETRMMDLQSLIAAKHTDQEQRLEHLTTKCDKLKFHQPYNSPHLYDEAGIATTTTANSDNNKKRPGSSSTSSRRISKTLFNLKRRLSETNESGKSTP